MRIVVNDIAASTGGAMSVLRDFYSCVCEYDHENEWIFLLNERYFEETENVRIIALPEIKASGFKKVIFDFVTGRKYISRLNPDVVFSLQNIITFGVKIPQVVYIHQSIPFQSIKRFSFLRGAERKLAVIQHLIGRIIKISAKKSDYVIVQTKWMKEAVCRLCKLSDEKVVTFIPGLKKEQFEQVEIERSAFFYPTASAVYKNNDCIRKASAILDGKGIAHKVTLTLPPEESSGSIVNTGRLPHDEVMARYRNSTLVFPSYIETFGYPLAEARMVGTIVLAADTPFSREVLEGYENAYFFPFDQPECLAELMEAVITGEIVRKDAKRTEDSRENANSWIPVMRYICAIV